MQCILCDGARRALHAAIEEEVAECIRRSESHLEADGQRLAARNDISALLAEMIVRVILKD